jgi:hypothetical protein
MIFRLSHRLARKVKVGELDELALDQNPGADWSCRLFIANRRQYILISNTMSLYSCVMYGKGVTDRDLFVRKTLDAIGEFMTADELQPTYQRLVAPRSAEVSFAKSLNRSVTGSMSDQIHGSKLYLSDGFGLPEIGCRLNDTPLSALTSSNGRKYAMPREVFVRLTDHTLG